MSLRLNDGKLLLNLVDLPGSCECVGEVTAATRVCDGGVVVVDINEGSSSSALNSC